MSHFHKGNSVIYGCKTNDVRKFSLRFCFEFSKINNLMPILELLLYLNCLSEGILRQSFFQLNNDSVIFL